ncbi:MAG: penicillin acylase family protein, partial [Parachlamydia sp.]|nr:penicillin acylase family protein [Parachlamydia sp.]
MTKMIHLFVAASLLCCRTGFAKHEESSSNSLTITRDSFGVPHIKGGNLKEIFRAIGLVHAEDRLTQIFLTTILANGRLSEFVGPGPGGIFVQSDVFQREINYTDAEVQKQIDKCFTKRTRLVITEFVKGINDRVDVVNANFALMPYELKALGFNPGNPLPHFSLFDVIRANQFFLQSFSTSSIPMFQLTNLADVVQLIANAGGDTIQAFEIFADVDPTTDLIDSQSTILPTDLECTNEGALECSSIKRKKKHPVAASSESEKARLIGHAQDAAAISKMLHTVKKVHEKYGPGWGSNGEAIGKSKSASGNPLLRCAIQPNFNHPSDFYQVIVDSKEAKFHADIFSPAIAPLAVGVYQQHGLTVETGAVFSNDFLIECACNIKSERQETIKIRGLPDLVITVFRSNSGGWVIQRPLASDPTMMLTLRSVFLGIQLRALNQFVEQAFVTSFSGFKNAFLNPNFQSDISLFEGQYADTSGNIATFHTGGWTKLPGNFDRRFPQGVPFNAAPSNEEYCYDKIARGPLFDSNGEEGFYVAWNTIWNNKIPASSDLASQTSLGLSRVYWIRNFLEKKNKISFEDLEKLSFEQAVANSLHAF